MLVAAGIETPQHLVRRGADGTDAIRRTFERFVVNQPRRAVGRQHDVELDGAKPQRLRNAQPGQGILRRQRAAAAVGEDARQNPGRRRDHL